MGAMQQSLLMVASASYYSYTKYATVIDDSGNANTSITANFNTDGSMSFSLSAGDSIERDFFDWHDAGVVSGIGNSRWAKKTYVSGDVTTGTLTTTLVALSSFKTINIQTVAGEARSGVYLVEFYSDSGGTAKVGEISFTITAAL